LPLCHVELAIHGNLRQNIHIGTGIESFSQFNNHRFVFKRMKF